MAIGLLVQTAFEHVLARRFIWGGNPQHLSGPVSSGHTKPASNLFVLPPQFIALAEEVRPNPIINTPTNSKSERQERA
jgi:hypothetical protein